MSFKIYHIVSILFLGLLVAFNVNNIEAQRSGIFNTFKDPTTGISLQYPSDWHIASKEYVDSIFDSVKSSSTNSLADKSIDNTIKPIVMLLPESLSGSAFFILPEILPFQLTLEKYFESTKRNILLDPSTQVSNAVPILVDGLNALKYNVTYNDSGFTQNQILFIKDSKGYVIASQLGSIDQAKESKDLNSIIASFKFSNTLNSNKEFQS